MNNRVKIAPKNVCMEETFTGKCRLDEICKMLVT